MRALLPVAALALAGLAPASASAVTHPTTTLTVVASNTAPVVGETIAYWPHFSTTPSMPHVTYYDNGIPIPGCTNLWAEQRCWTEYSEPGTHSITATLNSQEEEEEFNSGYELAEPVVPLSVQAFSPGTTCTEITCTAHVAETGSLQTWVVPAGVSSATFVLSGAGGGGGEISYPGSGSGGSGGKITATLPVSAGSTLDLLIGGRGMPSPGNGTAVAGGYGGGGAGGVGGHWAGASGGGGSFVFAPDGSLLLAAGGGGGAGNLASGGNGGQVGATGAQNGGASGGGGATASAPGLGSNQGGHDGGGPTQTTAIEGVGGAGASAKGEARSGGGGGGGYYGGGGGGGGTENETVWASLSGGGGGSDFVASSATGVLYEDGFGGVGGEDTSEPAGAGSLEITYEQPTQAPSGEAPSENATETAPEQTTGAPSPETGVGTPAVGTPGSPSAQTSASSAPEHQRVPVPHLTVYTHGGQGVINSHGLKVKAGCGDVTCTVHVAAIVAVPGLRGLRTLVGASTAIPASRVGQISVPVPAGLRRRIRDYLLRHRNIRGEVHLAVTDVGASGATETVTETLPVWTLPGLR
jgi:hypothetical protein